jgi:RNA polymerase sigma-70 factor (ECF subfamily)
MEHKIAEIYERNVDSVYRICFMYMKNKPDTEDMTQNAFVKLTEHLRKNGFHSFDSAEHETAWIIRVAVNLCKNSLKSYWNRRVSWQDWSDDNAETHGCDGGFDEPDETLAKLMKLPAHFKTALYLHYYEGHSTAEIAKMMKKPEATVRGYLHRGRKTLKTEIEQEQTKEEEIWLT